MRCAILISAIFLLTPARSYAMDDPQDEKKEMVIVAIDDAPGQSGITINNVRQLLNAQCSMLNAQRENNIDSCEMYCVWGISAAVIVYFLGGGGIVMAVLGCAVDGFKSPELCYAGIGMLSIAGTALASLFFMPIAYRLLNMLIDHIYNGPLDEIYVKFDGRENDEIANFEDFSLINTFVFKARRDFYTNINRRCV